jgi:hypothetical protein
MPLHMACSRVQEASHGTCCLRFQPVPVSDGNAPRGQGLRPRAALPSMSARLPEAWNEAVADFRCIVAIPGQLLLQHVILKCRYPNRHDRVD